MIQVLPLTPPQLVSRMQKGDLPAQCACGSTFIWRACAALRCPGCGDTQMDEQVSAAAVQGFAQHDRALVKPDAPIPTQETETMSITMATQLAQALREQIDAAKKEVSDAHTSVGGAVQNILASAAMARGIAKQLNQEAADLQAAVGLSSNGG